MSFQPLRSSLQKNVLFTFPTVITNAASSITTTTATGNGQVASAGGSAVTERGVVFSTSPQPTTAGTKVTSGSGVGTFTASMTGLSSNTLYHYRAYAINSIGTGYGDDVIFTTSTAVASIAPMLMMMGMGA